VTARNGQVSLDEVERILIERRMFSGLTRYLTRMSATRRFISCSDVARCPPWKMPPALWLVVLIAFSHRETGFRSSLDGASAILLRPQAALRRVILEAY